MKKLPENLKVVDDNDEVLSHPFSQAIEGVVKSGKVKAYEDKESGVSKTASDIVRDFFLMHFQATDENPAELPDGFEKYEKVFEKVGEMAKEHVAADKREKEGKDAEKEAKRQLKLADKEQKEKDEADRVKAQATFEDSLVKKFGEAGDWGKKVVDGIVKAIKLPDNITFTGNNMGIAFGDNVTVEQMGQAAAGIIGAMEGNAALAGSLQFMIGDLINNAMKRRLFRTRNDAQGAFAFIVKEKLKKSYNPGTLAYYSTMADRIPTEKRLVGINPTLYLQATKAGVPKLKDSDQAATTALEKEFEEFRATLVDGINDGSLDAKTVNAKIEEFKASKGVVKKNPGEVRERILTLLKQLFHAQWAKDNLVKDDKASFRMEEKGTLIGHVPVGVLTDLEEEAKNELQNLLIPNADEVITGTKKVDGKDVNVYMTFPFSNGDGPSVEKEETAPKKEEKKAE